METQLGTNETTGTTTDRPVGFTGDQLSCSILSQSAFYRSLPYPAIVTGDGHQSTRIYLSMTKGTMKRDGGQKYDGKRRGWAKFDTRMSNECLGNELLEQLWAGTDVNLPEGTSEAQRTAFSTKWFAAKFLDLSEKMQKQFVKEQTLKVQIRLAKISWFKKMDNSTIGAANTEINKLKWTKIYQARRVLHNLYGANQDTSIRWMEKGLRDACFWDPPP